MKIHEYQGKALFSKHGIPVPEGVVAKTVDGAVTAYDKLKTNMVVVKSQIHAGGRGKGKIFDKNNPKKLVLDGGVKLAKSKDEVKKFAQAILGNCLVTHQTNEQGKTVKTLLIEQGCDIKKEYYLGLTLDRASSRITIMASSEGGMDIEEVAAKTPYKILKTSIDPAVGFQGYQGRDLGFALNFDKTIANKFTQFCEKLYHLFVTLDCEIVEINPLVLTKQGELLALDAKINFENNALYRHPELTELRDLDEEDPQELEASEYDLSYIALTGNIGCMVNGAGLAMATMDIIKIFGGEPANFLDVGGGATQEKVAAAFKIILKDANVKAILVNIFGGIMKCDVIAEGIVAAAKEMGVPIPLVVRLQGTNVEIGKKILEDSGFDIISADTMADAAEKVVEAVA